MHAGMYVPMHIGANPHSSVAHLTGAGGESTTMNPRLLLPLALTGVAAAQTLDHTLTLDPLRKQPRALGPHLHRTTVLATPLGQRSNWNATLKYFIFLGSIGIAQFFIFIGSTLTQDFGEGLTLADFFSKTLLPLTQPRGQYMETHPVK